MDEPQFLDSKNAPTDAALAALLGRAQGQWPALVQGVVALEPKATGEWRFYKSSGWTFVVRNKKRNLLYLRPIRGKILASTALGESAYKAALKSDLLRH